MSMIPKRNSFSYDEENKWSQVGAALIACYICISGGNISGFTSSAILSMRNDSYRLDYLCNSSSDFRNGDVPKIGVVIPTINLSVYVNFSNVDNVGAPSNDNRSNNKDTNCTFIKMAVIDEFHDITTTQASWIGGLAPLGAFFGSLGASISVKVFGPKGSILFFGCPLFLISWMTTALAQSIWMVYIARFLGGMALGLTVSASPLYIIGTASITLRGPLGTLTQFLYTFGVLASFILGSFLNWRQLAWTCAAMVVPGIFMLMLIPESPVWLLSKNRMEDAEYAFQKMHGKSADCTLFLESNREAPTIVDQNSEKGERSGITLFWKLSKPERKSCFVAFALCIFQQLCGINAINFYAVSIFRAASKGTAAFVLSDHVSSVIVAAVFCFATFPSYFLIEKCGRKLLLLTSIAVMIVCSTGLGTYFFVKDSVENSSAVGVIPLVCLITFVLAFSSGFGPILYILVAEILSPEIRPIFGPLAIGVNWLAVFAVTKTFPDLISVTGIHGAFWLYACLSFVGLIFVIFCVPETKGKTEKEIENYFL